MSKFMEFKLAIQTQFSQMAQKELFVVNVGKDELWETYLNSFPKGTNEIFRERREHDCQCCKQFIRACGNVVAIVDYKLISIWDIAAPDHFQVVADEMRELIESSEITDVFRHYQAQLGTDFNHQLLDNEQTIKWEHFYFKLPKKFVELKKDIGSLLSKFRSNKEVFKRGLEEITPDAINTVLELIDQNSLYRGEEHKKAVKSFSKLKTEYALNITHNLDNFTWVNAKKTGARIRNTAIGTLLIDLSDGMDLTKAVGRFESKVAPQNYKRSSSLITKGMIAKAQKKVEELGITDSLSRRYAVSEDITINNVLFADRQTKKVMDNIFDELANDAPAKTKKKLGKIEDVSIDKFVDDILPNIDTMEILVENPHVNNFMSLIAPQEKMSRQIFKWGNNFSWSYNGEVTDSIKERVKRAGGNVSGVLRCSLSWYNYDDLDIHVKEPNGNHIYYGDPQSRFTYGKLDVDMNAGGHRSREAVENIVWTNKTKMKEGRYRLFINQYQQRETKDFGFEVEIDCQNKIHTFHYDKNMKNKENVEVAEFTYSHKDGIKLINSMTSTQAIKDIWGIKTQKFHNVKMIMNSPNHWDDEETGNKHYFFILENCMNPETSRGFFNEFLNEHLNEHRKVFEVLGSKMKVEQSDNQLSGLGFSSTKRNKITCKVTGNFTRTININF